MEVNATLQATYSILDYNLETLQSLIVRLNRRATKLGLCPLTLSIDTDHAFFIDEKDRDGKPFIVKRIPCTIARQSPILDGWSFVATIQHLEEGNILRSIPGTDIPVPESYRTIASNCDHCRVQRSRNDTYLVYHAKHGLKQVGSSCIKDFLGHSDPHELASYLQCLVGISDLCCLKDDDEGNFGSGSGSDYWRIETVLTQAATVIRLDGFTSRTKAKESFNKVATADVVTSLLALSNADLERDLELKHYAKQEEADKDLAQAALAWARNLSGSDLAQDYLWNLHVACQAEAIDYRLMGLVVSAIPAYHKATSAKIEREQQAATSTWRGTIGKREVFSPLTLTRKVEFPGQYGLTTFNSFVDNEGNAFSWKQSGGNSWEIGAVLTVKATVKEHSEYKGIKQTVLTRATVQ